ncbi:MAG: T9SS type A sorting domain-containing protein [Candidatus Cloacimonadota bacterium]|nr:MAG: T9SS type A sorting domain-containing protein [Candidatus Cloacimonadota bacterium]
MKIKLGFIILFCIFAVTLSAQPAKADSIVRVGACATPGLTWGVFVQDSFAYVADYNHFTIVNVSLPVNPTVVGSLFHPLYSGVLGSVVRDTIAYLNSFLSGRFVEVSVSDPTAPYVLGSCWTYTGSGLDAKGICIKDNLAYIALGNTGFEIINAVPSTSPEPLDTFDTPGTALDLFVKDTLIYIADYDSLLIVSIADSTNPYRVGACKIPNGCYDVFVVDTFAYATSVSNFGSDGSVQVVNVSNPASPQIVASADNLNGAPIDIWISGDYAYIAAADYWNVSKGRDRQIGGLKHEYASNRRADVEGGLRIVHISDPLSPTLVASYDTPGDPRGVFAVDTLVFIADYDSLQILKHIVVGVKEDEIKEIEVSDLGVLHVYPNPFNTSTSICYQLTDFEFSTLKIYDVSGRLVETLFNGIQKPGLYKFQWDRSGDLSGVPKSGFYFCQLRVGSKKINQKIVKIE